MENASQFLVPVALGVVLLILMLGLWNMMRGGSGSTSQNPMRARVVAQFAAIVVARRRSGSRAADVAAKPQSRKIVPRRTSPHRMQR